MNKPITPASIRSKLKNALIFIVGPGGLVAAAVLIYTTFFKNENSEKNVNQIEVTGNTNSPVANEIQTQNNFFGDTSKNSEFQKGTKHQSEKKKSTTSKKNDSISPVKESSVIIHAENAKIVTNNQSGGTNVVNEKPQPSPLPLKDTIPAKEAVINLYVPNALIATNNQSGGKNTVVQQIPHPKIWFEKVYHSDKVVTRVNEFPRQAELPSEYYPYDSLYQAEFSIGYYNEVVLNEVLFTFANDSIVDFFTQFNGEMRSSEGEYKNGLKFKIFQITQPSNGVYHFSVYSTKPFNPKTHFIAGLIKNKNDIPKPSPNPISDTVPRKDTTLNAPNTEIITLNQTGGTNVVNNISQPTGEIFRPQLGVNNRTFYGYYSPNENVVYDFSPNLSEFINPENHESQLFIELTNIGLGSAWNVTCEISFDVNAAFNVINLASEHVDEENKFSLEERGHGRQHVVIFQKGKMKTSMTAGIVPQEHILKFPFIHPTSSLHTPETIPIPKYILNLYGVYLSCYTRVYDESYQFPPIILTTKFTDIDNRNFTTKFRVYLKHKGGRERTRNELTSDVLR